MENSTSRRAIVFIALAVLVSAIFGIGAVFAYPTQAPSDQPYVSPTFNNLNVKSSGTVGSLVLNGDTIQNVAGAGYVNIEDNFRVAQLAEFASNINAYAVVNVLGSIQNNTENKPLLINDSTEVSGYIDVRGEIINHDPTPTPVVIGADQGLKVLNNLSVGGTLSNPNVDCNVPVGSPCLSLPLKISKASIDSLELGSLKIPGSFDVYNTGSIINSMVNKPVLIADDLKTSGGLEVTNNTDLRGPTTIGGTLEIIGAISRGCVPYGIGGLCHTGYPVKITGGLDVATEAGMGQGITNSDYGVTPDPLLPVIISDTQGLRVENVLDARGDIKNTITDAPVKIADALSVTGSINNPALIQTPFCGPGLGMACAPAPVKINDDLDVSGDIKNTATGASVKINDNLSVTGTTTFTGNTNVTGNVAVTGNMTVTGKFGGNITVRSVLPVSVLANKSGGSYAPCQLNELLVNCGYSTSNASAFRISSIQAESLVDGSQRCSVIGYAVGTQLTFSATASCLKLN